MGTQENVQLVEKAYANFKQGNIAAILEVLSEDVDWFIPGPTEIIPFVGRRLGPRQVGEFFAALAESQTALEFEPREFISQGEKVIVFGYQRWNVKSTGRPYGDDWAHVFTIRNGKIAQFREYHDTHAEAAAHKPKIL
jgi:ketosteroid isomerase-like protein